MTYRSALLGASVLMIAVPALAGPTPPSYVPDLLPPNPVAGECYGRVEIPARYETTTEQVTTREAHQRLMVQQAKLQSTTERVLVKEPSVRYVVRQPTYSTVSHQVLTRPGFDKLSVSEPRFETVTETLQKGQARLVWKRGNPAKLRAQGYKIHSTADSGVGGQGYRSTTQYGQTGGQQCGNVCEIWCLVEEPGESVTVTRQRLSQPGQIHRTPVHPQYQTVTKQVVTDPGGVQKIPVPGEYRNLHVEKLVRPAGTASINVPAEYGHAQGRRLVSEARYEWRRVVCKPGQETTTRHQTTHHQTPHHQIQQPQTSHYKAPYVQGSTHRVNAYPDPARHKMTIHQRPVAAHSVPAQTHSQTRVYSGGSAVHSGTTAYTSQPRTGYYTPTTTTLPLQGQLTHSAPAYTSTYQPPQLLGPAFSGAPQEYVTEQSSAYPDRTYSGPAYMDPSRIDSRSAVIDNYERRHTPIRARR